MIQTLDSIGLMAGAAPGLMLEPKGAKARREGCRPFGAQILSQSYPGLTPLGSASFGPSGLHDDCESRRDGTCRSRNQNNNVHRLQEARRADRSGAQRRKPWGKMSHF